MTNINFHSIRIVQSVALTTREVAKYLGLIISTLNLLSNHGSGPEYLKLGDRHYRQENLNRFLETRIFRSMSEQF